MMLSPRTITIIVVSLVILGIVVFVAAYLWPSGSPSPAGEKKTEERQEEIGRETPDAAAVFGKNAEDAILIATPAGTVAVDNFYRGAKVGEGGAVTFIEKDSHFISYDVSISRFWIAVTAKPFAAYRAAAEEDFLGALRVSQEDACRLNVLVTSFGANAELVRNTALSFCPGRSGN